MAHRGGGGESDSTYTAEKRRYKQDKAMRRIEAGGEELMEEQSRMAAEQGRMRDLLERMHQLGFQRPPVVQQPIIVQPAVQPRQPMQGIINYPAPVASPSIIEKKDATPKIYIKNIAKAIANERKVRFKKTSSKVKKRDLKKQYSRIKSDARKRIKSGKKAHYVRENKKIEKMPVKQRKAARTKLKAELDTREKTLMKSLPSAAKIKFVDLRKVISKAKQLKW